MPDNQAHRVAAAEMVTAIQGFGFSAQSVADRLGCSREQVRKIAGERAAATPELVAQLREILVEAVNHRLGALCYQMNPLDAGGEPDRVAARRMVMSALLPVIHTWTKRIGENAQADLAAQRAEAEMHWASAEGFVETFPDSVGWGDPVERMKKDAGADS
jgi:hypothetical protein